MGQGLPFWADSGLCQALMDLASCVSTPQSLRLIPWDVASVCSLPPPPSVSPVPILLQVQLSSALPPARAQPPEAHTHSPPPGCGGAAPHVCSLSVLRREPGVLKSNPAHFEGTLPPWYF